MILSPLRVILDTLRFYLTPLTLLSRYRDTITSVVVNIQIALLTFLLGVLLPMKIEHSLLGSVVFPILLIVTCDINRSVLLEFIVVVRGLFDGLLPG